MVHYLAIFLPQLADSTAVLDKLTKKECDKHFPAWTTRHQTTFEMIKNLVVSPECLTMINPLLMPEYKIFITTDASDFGSGAILAFAKEY